MIVSVTLNPALHVDYAADRVQLGTANEVGRVRHRVGGRGLAMARLVHTFGHDVTAAGLAGGSAGELIKSELARVGVATRFTRIAAETRRVVRVTDSYGHATSFREPAPYITTEELGRLAADYRAMLDDATAVVLSGTLPAGLPTETYGSLTSYATAAGVPVILDAGGSALRYGAARGPALVVPDIAADAAGLDPACAGTVVLATERGAQAVTPKGRWLAEISPTANESAHHDEAGEEDLDGYRAGLVAGLVPGLALGWSWPDMLRHAVALAASASASGEADLVGYEALLPEVVVTGPAGMT